MTNSVLTKFVSVSLLLASWPVKGLGENQRPVADAGLPRYAATDPVQLDGTRSYDPDKSGPLTYTWRQISGPSVKIADANTDTPKISGIHIDGRGRTVPGPFVQTDAIQECEFELVVSDGDLTSLPDTVKVIIVPNFGATTMRLENASFDAGKPTFIYFGGGTTCALGYAGQYISHPDWISRANIIDFPYGYEPDIGTGTRTFSRYADMIIVYLSSVAPDYRQLIQSSGWSAGGQPAIDVSIRLNSTYRDARYAVNHVTLIDVGLCLQEPEERIGVFLDNPVDGEQCWVDSYAAVNKYFYPNVLNVDTSLTHAGLRDWYGSSVTAGNANQFNRGVLAGAYWSVVGPGKNLQLALTPHAQTYKFRWTGSATAGQMELFNELQHPARLPEPVTLLVWRYPWLADSDPNGTVLTCTESENAVGYQLVSGSDPYNLGHYNILADSNRPPAISAAMLPSSDAWWTVKVRDAYGSTIYADPIRVDSTSALGAIPAELVDFNQDYKVDMQDFSELAQHWRQYEPSVDIIPVPDGDHVVDVKELVILAECWLKEVPEPPEPGLVARWKLDETEGFIAHDSVRPRADALVWAVNPLWRPAGGKVRGALELDGVDDSVNTGFVLNPADGAFSVFAWVQGGASGQVIISQVGGANWLSTGPSGNLMTDLNAPGTGGPLISQTVITDGAWHHVGVTWDGANRTLYVDDAEVAKDTQAALGSSRGGLYFGAGKDRKPGSFWSGLIDDVKIYDRAVTP